MGNIFFGINRNYLVIISNNGGIKGINGKNNNYLAKNKINNIMAKNYLIDI